MKEFQTIYIFECWIWNGSLYEYMRINRSTKFPNAFFHSFLFRKIKLKFVLYVTYLCLFAAFSVFLFFVPFLYVQKFWVRILLINLYMALLKNKKLNKINVLCALIYWFNIIYKCPSRYFRVAQTDCIIVSLGSVFAQTQINWDTFISMENVQKYRLKH